MQRILPASRRYPTRSRRGFNLIEMSVVITILLLMTAVIVPNFVSLKRSRDLRNAESDLARLPVEARNEARRSNEPVSLRVDNNNLVEERHPQDGSDPEEVKRLTLNPEMETVSARLRNDSTDVASWNWTTTPDGSSDSGGLTFTEGNTRRSLVLDADGGVRWITGDIPDNTDERWQAGNLEQRVQTN